MNYSRSYLLQKPKKTVRRKSKRVVVLAALMLLILAVVFSANLISTFRSIHNSADWAGALRLQKRGDEQIYLLYGVDYRGASPYIDRLLLLHHDPVNAAVSLLYIPGNTLIETEDGSSEPLGRLYRHLEEPAFIELVQELTGIPVHHYLSLDYQGIAVLGDYLGGVENAGLKDETGAGIRLQREKERLNGFELYRYFLTADHPGPPWEQLCRQQQIMAALWSKMERKRFWQWPRIVRLLSPYLETDLSWRELTALKEQFAEYSFAEMKQLTLPGEEKTIGGYLYWVPDASAIRDMANLLGDICPVKPSEVRVEVLNGSGVEGLAAAVAALLKEEGFQIVGTGNADHFNYTATQVIALGEDVEKARAAALYIPGADLSMLHQYDPEARVDVRVIVGSSYAEHKKNP